MIGKKLRELIKSQNIKQIKLAKYLGISPSRLSNYLSDKREPDLEMLAKMASYLSVDLNYFTEVKFFASDSTGYRLPAVDNYLAMEGTSYSNSSLPSDVVEISTMSINTKKRATKTHKTVIGRQFVKNVVAPEENAILFEVTVSIGGDYFKQDDYVIAAAYDSIKPKNGSLVFEIGRNGKLYRYFEENGNKMLLCESTKTISPITDDLDLSCTYVVLWVFSKQ